MLLNITTKESLTLNRIKYYFEILNKSIIFNDYKKSIIFDNFRIFIQYPIKLSLLFKKHFTLSIIFNFLFKNEILIFKNRLTFKLIR